MHESTIVPGRPPKFVTGVKRVQENMRKVFPTALKSGMKFSIGTDARHGNYVFELISLGLKPIEAIRAGTLQAAEALGIDDMVGTIEPGKLADIIGVPGDPLLNISDLRNVQFVMKEGLSQILSER